MAVWFAIENEIGNFPALRIEAPIMKQDALVALPARHFVETRGAQLVGIDIDLVERNRNGLKYTKRFHARFLVRSIFVDYVKHNNL